MNHHHSGHSHGHGHDMRRSRPKSQVMTLDNSSPPPPPQRKNGSLPQQQRWYENDGELKERQLQELKTRMRQMEKTMRWWSDCATNWREKWSQLRLERNHVKEDLKNTQTEMEKVYKELEFYKGRSALCTPTPTTPNANGRHSEMNSFHSGGSGAKNKRIQTDPVDYLKSDEVIRLEKSVARYLLMLEEANRTIIAEREDKIILHHTVERLQRDLQDLQELYDNLKKEMYELKDFSEMDESYCGEREDPDHDLDRLDGGCGLSDDEELNGAVGFTPSTSLGYGLGLENDKLSPLNYQTSLFVDLSERRGNEVSPPILQIVEDSDLHRRDQEMTTVVSSANVLSPNPRSHSSSNSNSSRPELELTANEAPSITSAGPTLSDSKPRSSEAGGDGTSGSVNDDLDCQGQDVETESLETKIATLVIEPGSHGCDEENTNKQEGTATSAAAVDNESTNGREQNLHPETGQEATNW